MKDLARQIAMHFLGKPYIWGGDDPSGFDCSGFCIEILKSVGILPRDGDWTAEALFEMFKDYAVADPKEGCLVFWKRPLDGKIIHVEYCLDTVLAIGASGGARSTDSPEDAWRANAYIKIRPFRTSKRLLAGYVNPYLGGRVDV